MRPRGCSPTIAVAVNGGCGAFSHTRAAGVPRLSPEALARFHAAAATLASAPTVEQVLKRMVHSARSLAHADSATLAVLEPHAARDRVLWSGCSGDGAAVTVERELAVRGRPYAILRLATVRPAFTADEEQLVDLLCVHANVAIELVELRGCDLALRRVRELVAEPAAGPRVDSVLEVGDVQLDRARHEVFVGGVRVHLTPSEFRLLELLTEEPGRAYTRDEILERLWGTVESGSPRVADVHAGRLRRKLERAGPDGHVLASVRGVGYKIVPSRRDVAVT